jgi:hypothetical protein
MLLLLDVWPLGRFTFTGWRLSLAQRTTVYRLVWEKVPFLVLAILFAIATYVTQQTTGAVASVSRIPVTFRLANAMVSYAMYVVTMLWPSRLALFYPYPLALSPMLVSASLVGLIAATVLVLRSMRRYPYLAVGWLWYLGSLVPVIGLIQAGDQARADRFTYVPLIGLFIMIAWGARDLITRPRILQASGALVVVLLAAVARTQVGHCEPTLSSGNTRSGWLTRVTLRTRTSGWPCTRRATLIDRSPSSDPRFAYDLISPRHTTT